MLSEERRSVSFRTGEGRVLLLFEGLPHQAWERAAFARERAREDVIELAGWPFYRDPMPLSDETADVLTSMASAAGSFRTFGGEKRCGGYHPDFALAWVGPTERAMALLCFGCNEALLVDGGDPVRADLHADFSGVLRSYRVNRPVPDSASARPNDGP